MTDSSSPASVAAAAQRQLAWAFLASLLNHQIQHEHCTMRLYELLNISKPGLPACAKCSGGRARQALASKGIGHRAAADTGESYITFATNSDATKRLFDTSLRSLGIRNFNAHALLDLLPGAIRAKVRQRNRTVSGICVPALLLADERVQRQLSAPTVQQTSAITVQAAVAIGSPGREPVLFHASAARRIAADMRFHDANAADRLEEAARQAEAGQLGRV